MGLPADIADDLFPLVKGHSADPGLGGFGGGNGIVHISKNAMLFLRRFRNLHLRYHFLYNVLYQAFLYKHFTTSSHMDLP